MVLYLPLNDDKTPAVAGWNRPSYRGVDPHREVVIGGRVGLRCDGIVVIDCDNELAWHAWFDLTGTPTYTVKTPRGRHLYYDFTPGSPTGPAVGVYPKTDIRAGIGSYVVAPPTPGYEVLGSHTDLEPFDPEWLPGKYDQARVLPEAGDTGWDTIAEGERNATLARYAGTFRASGMSADTMAGILWGINSRCCDPPLDKEEIVAIASSISRYSFDPS